MMQVAVVEAEIPMEMAVMVVAVVEAVVAAVEYAGCQMIQSFAFCDAACIAFRL